MENGDVSKSEQLKQEIDEVSFLDAQIDKLLEEEYQQQEDSDKSTAKRAVMIADMVARKYELKGQQWALSSISGDVATLYRSKGLRCWEWIHNFLPDKYKNPNRILGQSFRVTLDNDWKNQLEELTQYAIQQADANTERDVFEALEKNARKVLEDCDRKKIALVNEYGDNKSAQEEKQVSIIKPKAMHTICVEKAHQVGDAFHEYADVLQDFPPELPADQQKIAQGLDIFLEMLKPSLDLKWTKCWGRWFKVELDRLDYGKHAAAVKQYTDTNLCPVCTDLHDDPREKIEPIIVELQRNPESATGWSCPKCGCTDGMKRDMTREQVGDKSKQVVRFARKIADNFEGFALGLFFHHQEYLEKKSGARKIRLAPTLSSKA